MGTWQEAIDAVRPVDREARARAQARLDRLTKPVGSLGRLEELAAQYASITGKVPPESPRAAVFTFAADHGIAGEGVSAYPSAVTPQMVLNFLRGGAAVNVLARHAGAEVRVVDIGVAHEFGSVPGLIDRKIAFGTKNFAVEPAMSRSEAERALSAGVELAAQAAREGLGLIGTGDMGIGNTTPSAAITAVLTGSSVDVVTGRGTGIDDEGYRRKVAVIERALALHRPDPHDPLDLLSKVGGFEIAGLAGLIIGSAGHRMPIVLDGFISGAAALVAAACQPLCREYMMASHLSVERGHQMVLRHLSLKPLLDIDLRLGEGTGACIGIDLVQASLKILAQMATFGEAGVSERSS